MIAIIGGISTLIASAFLAWGTAGSRVNAIDTKVEVAIERENNHYAEVQKQLNSVNEKLDKLLDQKISVKK